MPKTYNPVTDPLPFNRKMMNAAPADAAQNLDEFQQYFADLAKEIKALARSNSAIASYTRTRTMLNTGTGQRDNGMDLIKMYSKGKGPIANFSQDLRKTNFKTVKQYVSSNPQRMQKSRDMAKVGQSMSNYIVDMFNDAFSKGANKQTLDQLAQMFLNAKGRFNTKGFLKDKVSKKGYKALFGSVHRDYDHTTGTLCHKKLGNKDMAFYRYLIQYTKRNKGKKGGAGSTATDDVEEFDEEIRNASIWIYQFGKALNELPFGELAKVIGEAEQAYVNITDRMRNEDGSTWTGKNYLENLKTGGENLWGDLKLTELTGKESPFSTFSRNSRFFTDPTSITSEDWARDAQGNVTGLKGKDSLFGKLGAKFGQAQSGMAFGGGKVGGIIGKAMGIAMKTPVGAILGVVGGIGKAAIGIFKFLAKSSPILQAVGDILNLFFTLFFMPIGNALGEIILPLMEGLIDWVLKWNDLWTDFSWDKFGAFLWDMVSGILNFLISIPQAIWNLLLDLWKLMFSDVPLMLADFFDSIGWHGVADFFRNFGTAVGQGIQNIKDFVNNIYNSIKSFFSDPVGTIKNAISGIGGGIVDGVKSFLGLAEGGIVQPSPGGTLALLAEAGEPEAVIPLSEFDNVFGTAGQTVVVNINGDIYGMSDFESKVESVINRVSNRSAYR